ncbi:hypothetical protein LC607_17695 [Nostoc sp. CHAB 5824]|nr:hypothetical protein [Nostoc sp. CHAB 5824]
MKFISSFLTVTISIAISVPVVQASSIQDRDVLLSKTQASLVSCQKASVAQAPSSEPDDSASGSDGGASADVPHKGGGRR